MAAPPVKRCDDLWFSDGSVVLQAENMQFRVHTSILAREASAFKDMAAIGSSSNDVGVDGCPLVGLDDKASYLVEFIKAVYAGGLVLAERTVPFERIAACIELGKKYRAVGLYRRTVDFLREEFPMVPQETDRRSGAGLTYFQGMYCELIRLARRANLECLLPQLYLRAWQEDGIGTILTGVERAGLHGEPPSRVAALAPEDQRICMTGTFSLVQASLITLVTAADHRFCQSTRPSCVGWIARLYGARGVGQNDPPRYPFGLDPWRVSSDPSAVDDLGYLCTTCKRAFPDWYNGTRARLWNELPKHYGFSAWEELEQESCLSLDD